jgi:S-adenosylmethionine/arginine decarboxylase-like enzyme
MNGAWGKHLILDVRGCTPRLIRCPFHITDFSNTLVKRINMVPFGAPWVQHFGSGNKAGYTMVQLIETSNLVAHFAEEDNSAYIDVFSCKDFQKEDVEELVHQYFGPQWMTSRVVLRGEGQLQ